MSQPSSRWLAESWSILGLLLGFTVLSARPYSLAAEPDPAPARVEIRGEWFYVDGEPFLVKGVGYSPYRPGHTPWKNPVDLALMEQDVQRIRDAGFNTIRTGFPLPPEALDLADRYGLMVLQGLWVQGDQGVGTPAFQDALIESVTKEVQRSRGHRNILAYLIGDELQAHAVFEAGVPETEALLQKVTQLVRELDPTRLVSYANWPSTSFLNASTTDAICFHVNPFEPSIVSHVFGYGSYIEHLKQTVARGKPLIMTGVGLSPDSQHWQVVQWWQELFESGAQGGVVFEWNDAQQQSDDPDRVGTLRPAAEALKTTNPAIVLTSGLSGQDGELLVSLYTVESVADARVRMDRAAWQPATKVNHHWWKIRFGTDPPLAPGPHQLSVQVRDGQHRVLLDREQSVSIGPAVPAPVVSITTDQTVYQVGSIMESVTYTIRVQDAAGDPLVNWPVYWAIVEPHVGTELRNTKLTDSEGRVQGTYLIQESGFIILTAAAPRDPARPEQRVGAERLLTVHRQPTLIHQPSLWEEGIPTDVQEVLRHPQPAFQLADPGKERIVNYERYGRFVDVGKPTYHYDVVNWQGLAAAVGEGVYPNERGLLDDPAFVAAKHAGKLDGSQWTFTLHQDPQLAFFRWASAEEEPGVKQFYTALTLERAGLWLQAVKAYDATLVHHPLSVGWTRSNPPSPWYVGKVARNKIEAILRLHPELGMRLDGCRIVVDNGFDNSIDNDVLHPTPGQLLSVLPSATTAASQDVSGLVHTRELGGEPARLVRYENGHWQLLVDGHPWAVHGLIYQPAGVGEAPQARAWADWMKADRNRNGRPDVFETFVDANRNNQQDSDEPPVGDFALLRQLGVNTLRLYHTDHDPKIAKPILRQLYQEYGFRVLMGDVARMSTIGSGPRWAQGTDYLDQRQRRRMLNSVKRMVSEYKDEPYVLMWVLGDQDHNGGGRGIGGGAGNAAAHPHEYYRLINELAEWIHAADPNHPVVLGNGDLLFLDVIAQEAPAIDVLGASASPGWEGVGRSFFEDIRQWLDRPVLMTEYGCPAYQIDTRPDAAEVDQAVYHFGAWVDVADNIAGRGVGNVIGGMVFQWTDTKPNWPGLFPGGWNFKEWYGIASLGNGNHRGFLRQLRSSYRLYQRVWNQP